ncbi:MAG TPA: Xaa-Pro aminopeptidase, partial [Candidatus Saccharibacteria bacterium]|nr:Xaa-Pro aminopeptidase [Candidatus Saccharibacteria bacterium]
KLKMTSRLRAIVNNRQRLIMGLQQDVAIFSAHTLMQQSADSAYDFYQESNFWWLTGIEEPDWRLIIDTKKQHTTLIAPDIDETHHIFEGGLSFEEAKKISGVDNVISSAEGEKLISSLVAQKVVVATLGKDPRAKYYNFTLNPAPLELYRSLKQKFKSVVDCRLQLARLRAIKQPHEIKAIRSATKLTVEAFEHVQKSMNNFKYEYDIEAEFDRIFKQNASCHAYSPIIAGNERATTLHYTKNNQPLSDGLVLIDVGARVDGYAADVTRTYSYGKPSARQQQVHQAVARAHQQIIALLGPGLAVAEYHDKVDNIMKAALADLGLLKKPKDYRTYFPHAISHGLGVDVHDALGQPTEFQENMVLTVEPGIYIPEEGIGVRIEDDILITKDGVENLSSSLPVNLIQ